jgi:hypothetical protein
MKGELDKVRTGRERLHPSSLNLQPSTAGPQPIGDILKKIVRKDGLGKKALQGRRLAQKVLAEALGPLAAHASVVSVKVGTVTVEADSSALFQELESFQRQKLVDAFRQAGMNVHEVRVTLAH